MMVETNFTEGDVIDSNGERLVLQKVTLETLMLQLVMSLTDFTEADVTEGVCI